MGIVDWMGMLVRDAVNGVNVISIRGCCGEEGNCRRGTILQVEGRQGSRV